MLASYLLAAFRPARCSQSALNQRLNACTSAGSSTDMYSLPEPPVILLTQVPLFPMCIACFFGGCPRPQVDDVNVEKCLYPYLALAMLQFLLHHAVNQH
jgi:hypothetical protein